MKNILLITILAILGFSTTISAQNELLEKGNTQYELMEFDDAIQSYLKHVKRNPSDKYAMINLAKSYNYIGDWDNAAKWYFEALGFSISSEHLLEHGLIQMKLGRYEAAKEQFVVYSNVNKMIGSNYVKMCDFAFSKKNMPSLFNVSKLPINTANSEFSPAFLGNDLAFVSGRKDITRTDATNDGTSGNDSKYNFIFKTETTGSQQPTYVRSWFKDNDLVNEGPISYSNDGQWVAYVENTYKEGVSKMAHDLFKGDIFIAKISSKGDWEQTTPFPYNGDYSNNFPQLSPDGNMLYFSSDKVGGQGGYDIYVSKKENGTWLEPRNVGVGINQAGNEICPFIDGEDFYFSSDYLTGFGGQDVFKANLKNGKWSISNLGTGVNTSANDYGYIYNKQNNAGYMVSDREGVENIYKVLKTSDDVKILVSDAATRVPIPSVTLDFKNCGKEVYTTNEQGKLSFKATAGADCFISIQKIGYERTKIDIGPSSNNNGIVEVLLYKEGEKYQGKIVDGIHDNNLANVKVAVINQGNGQKTEVYSDSEGIYTLALQPYSAYMIQFDKMGYVGVGDKIETEDGSDKGILGSQLLFPTNSEGGVSVPSVPNPITTPDPVVVVPNVTTPKPSPVVTPNPSPSVPTPVVTPSPSVPTPVVTTPNPTTPEVDVPSMGSSVSGYAVQLMSLSKGNKNFPKKIKDLKGMVTRVYTKTDDKWKRFRVGTYTARVDAESVLAYIKAMGFKSAYIVKEDAKGSIEEIVL